jgi:hypothetical protein
LRNLPKPEFFRVGEPDNGAQIFRQTFEGGPNIAYSNEFRQRVSKEFWLEREVVSLVGVRPMRASLPVFADKGVIKSSKKPGFGIAGYPVPVLEGAKDTFLSELLGAVGISCHVQSKPIQLVEMAHRDFLNCLSLPRRGIFASNRRTPDFHGHMLDAQGPQNYLRFGKRFPIPRETTDMRLSFSLGTVPTGDTHTVMNRQ